MINAEPISTAVDDIVVPVSCPDENVLSEFVQGLADEEVAAKIEQHLDGCAECRRIISSVGQSSYLAQRIRTRVDSASAAALAPSTASMGPASAAEFPPPGTVLAGKYRVERLLGQGGMGVVMAATHLTLGKLVAVKLMRPDLAVDPGATQRFVREARAASLLRSEHIARVIDLDTLEDGSPYIAMEYLEGEDLGATLVRRGAISAQEAATYIVQVCEAIAEAHAAGIVHRDLKPANLFLTMRGASPCVKVLDFGVSKIIANGPLMDDVATTDTKALVGSPHYMAPEQLISAKSVDPRTDVWALGCILFELVSGKNPFAGSALAQVLASILRDEVPSLQDVCPDLPAGFAPIVARCLDKDPARRYQRVDELAAALAPFVSGVSHDAPARGPVPVPSAPALGSTRRGIAPAPASPTPVRLTRPSRSRWPIALFVLVLGVLSVLGFVGYRLLGDRGLTTPRQPMLDTPATAAPAPIEMTVMPIDAGLAPEATAPSETAPAPDAGRRTRRKKRLEDDLIGPSLD